MTKKILINNYKNNPILVGVYFKGDFNFCFTDGNYNLTAKGITHTKSVLKALRSNIK